MAPSAESDQVVERRLGVLLRSGVILAATFVLAGGVVFLVQYGHAPAEHGTFTGEPAELTHAGDIVRTALALRGRGLIQLGLLILILTPVARVAFSLYAFVRQRDRTYVLFTAFVLVLLLSSLLRL